MRELLSGLLACLTIGCTVEGHQIECEEQNTASKLSECSESLEEQSEKLNARALLELPADQGVKIQRHLTSYHLDQQNNAGYTTTFTGDGFQPIVSWDGLLYLRQSSFRNRNGTTYKAGGLAAYVVDYKNSFRDNEDRLELKQTSQFSNGNQGVLVYKNLYYGQGGNCAGQYRYEVTQGSCSGTSWRITMDDAATSPLGAGTGLNELWHASIVPSPEREGENPFVSDIHGNPSVSGHTTFMTYEYLLIASAVRSPEAYDADFQSGHPLHVINQQRDRIVTGLGKIVVEFSVGPGGHRVPKRIVSGSVDRHSFGVIETVDSNANGNSMRVLRGIEPTITRDGKVLLFHSNLGNYNGHPGSASPGTEHILYTHRVQGNFFDPKCLRGTVNCLPLRFRTPRHATSMYSDRNLLIPGESITFQDKYPLFRHKISSPLGDHIYQPGTPLGLAYPWIQLDGQFLTGTASRGVGDFLDLTPITSMIHTNGGLEYCLNNGCQNAASVNYQAIRRESLVVIGNRLISTDTQGQKYFQMQLIDNPINEARRTLARVTSGTLGVFGGLWSASNKLPVDHMKAFKITPGDDVFPTIVAANNWSSNLGYLGRREIHALGQTKLEGHRSGYMIASNLVPGGFFRSQYSGTRNDIVTNFTRAQDVSGNNLQVELSYNVNTGGAFFPYNDPIKNYNGPLLDNERQIMTGRSGQGVTCTLDGSIEVLEGSHSRSGALSDYEEAISLQLWVKPLVTQQPLSLASSPAYTLSQRFDGSISFAIQLSQRSGKRSTLVVNSAAPMQKDRWYQITAQSFLHGSQRVVELFINGQRHALQTWEQSRLSSGQLRKGSEPWLFCPSEGSGTMTKVMMIDEIRVASRKLTDKEIRVASLQNDPVYESSNFALGQQSNILPQLLARNFDPNEFHIPESNPVTAAKAKLGAKLFFDRRLSSDGSVSCAGCHSPSHNFGTPHDHGKGEGVYRQRTSRAPTRLQNLGFHRPEDSFFWDGRAGSLEAQVTQPFSNPQEMGFSSIQPVIRKIESLSSEYGSLTRDAFGIPVDGIAEEHIAAALASYVRTLIVGNAPYDRFRSGETTALTAAQRRGYGTFVMNCSGCHSGADLSDNKFHNIGLYAPTTANRKDIGRMGVTGNNEDFMAFKTPGLRNLDGKENNLGHDGTKTLDEVIENYSNGGTHRAVFDNVAPTLTAIGLTQSEKDDLKDFLLNGLASR